MNKYIYLVTSGCYSDYSVDSVWTTQELADARVVEMAKGPYNDRAEVEIYWLDGSGAKEPMPYWHVGINGFEAGRTIVNSQELTGRQYSDTIRDDTSEKNIWSHFYVFAKDEGHAIKIASERRAAWRAAQA